MGDSRSMEETAEVLRDRCATYKEQLQQVEAALAVDSGNEQMIKLRIDLMQVIELTSELLGSATQEPEGEDAGRRRWVPDWQHRKRLVPSQRVLGGCRDRRHYFGRQLCHHLRWLAIHVS